MRKQEAGFVGDSRKKIVNGLFNVFQECVATSTPRWISLEGPSGCGKSRVVREFYRILAQSQADDQSTPAYWPESLMPDSNASNYDIHQRRKKVYPTWDGSAGALPSYMWWGIDCGELNGAPSERLSTALYQFDKHAEPLDKAYRESAINPFRLKNIFLNGAKAIYEEGASEATGEAVETGLKQSYEVLTEAAINQVLGVGLVIRTAKWIWHSQKEKRQTDAVIEVGKAIDNNVSLDPVDEAFDAIRRLSYKSVIPTIIFIEDLHDADEALVELLEKILRSSGNAVLVITTAWTAELDQKQRLKPLWSLFGREAILGDHFHRVTESGADHPDSPVQGAFDTLDSVSKQHIVRDYFPALDDRMTQALANRYQSPLLLELVLTEPWLQEDYGDELADLSLESIDSLPSTVDSYYQMTWDRLPESARETLIYAAAGVPHLIDSDLSRIDLEWSLRMLVDALNSAGISHRCVERLEDEPRIFGWCDLVDDRLSRFREWQHLDFSNDAGTLTDDRRLKVLTALAEQATEILENDPQGFGSSGYLEYLILALAGTKNIGRRRLDKPLIEKPAVIKHAAIRRMEVLAAFPRENQETIRLAEIALTCIDNPIGLESLRIRRNIAFWTGNIGDVSATLALSQSLLSDQERVLGSDHPDTLVTRNNIAFQTGTIGDVNGALALYQALLSDQERVLGPDHPSTLLTRSNIAFWTDSNVNANRTLALTQSLLPDQERVLGSDHPDTLRTRNNIASCTGDSGDVKGALALFQSLLSDQERVQGPDHPDTLLARSNIAYWTGESGDVKGALALFQALLPDRERILGSDHPDTLITRGNIASQTGESGDVSAALALAQALLSDQKRVLGSDHPDTLLTRNNFASWTGSSGDISKALALFQALLSDQERVLGPDHSHPLKTRHNLATWTSSSGDISAALALFQALLSDQERILGSDHPLSLATRNNIAFWTDESGDGKAAMAFYQALLPDQELVLGFDHQSTLTTRNNIAFLTGDGGDVGTALELFQVLLPDQERLLGSDHPDTLLTRSNIAYWTGENGDGKAALAFYQDLLPDRERVLGLDHPNTKTTREWITFWMGNIGTR